MLSDIFISWMSEEEDEKLWHQEVVLEYAGDQEIRERQTKPGQCVSDATRQWLLFCQK